MSDRFVKRVLISVVVLLVVACLAYAIVFQFCSSLYEPHSFFAGGCAGFGICALFWSVPDLLRCWRK